ncbi:MAG TPA: SGNH/GDSL hydrolase family protein, partial [Bacteroidota bacterium]|nr:SGNH/GDSL hydrolase family protein [Bacteroidota bacterium]
WIEPVATGEASPDAPHGKLVYRYPSNPRGYFDENNEVIGRINSAGFRGRETTLRKPPGVIRVAFLGDSFCLGIGVKDDHTLPARFEESMRNAQAEVEALNFGKSATSTDQQVDLLRDYVLRFDPDVVIVVMFLNDADRIMTIKFLSRPVILARIRKHSQFLNASFLAIERPLLERAMVRHYHQGYTDDSEGWNSIVTALEAGKRLSEEHNIGFLVTVYPVLIHLDGGRYPFTEIHQKIERTCESMRIPFVDLLPAFLGETDYEMWVHPTDQHPNEVAQAIAGEYLSDSLLGKAPFSNIEIEDRERAGGLFPRSTLSQTSPSERATAPTTVGR